jgi:hypothetical protein
MSEQTKGNEMNDWEYREPTQADCVPDKDGNYPMVEVWDDRRTPTKESRQLIGVLPLVRDRFVCLSSNRHDLHYTWRHARIRKSYAERQAEWIDRNGIKVGSRVRVTRAAKSGEDGWNNIWPASMDSMLHQTASVRRISNFGVSFCPYFEFPYFVLEPVTEPEYRNPTIDDIGKVIEVSRNGELWESFTLVGLHDGTYYITGILENVATPFKNARIKVGE